MAWLVLTKHKIQIQQSYNTKKLNNDKKTNYFDANSTKKIKTWMRGYD